MCDKFVSHLPILAEITKLLDEKIFGHKKELVHELQCTILKKFVANIEELKEEASTDRVAIAHLKKGIPIKTFTKEEHT